MFLANSSESYGSPTLPEYLDEFDKVLLKHWQQLTAPVFKQMGAI
jgi:hypothetical protein